MADRTQQLVEALDELARAVAAEGGAALYLDDGDGTLSLVAAARNGAVKPPSLVSRLRGRNDESRNLALNVPGARPGLVMLARRSGSGFTQQDRAVARMFVRRLSEGDLAASGAASHTGWTRQFEAIQHICARLARLGTIEEVGTTICSGTFEVIDNDEAHLLLVDDRGYLQSVTASARLAAHRATPGPLPYEGPAALHIKRTLSAGVPIIAHDLGDMGPGREGPHSMLIVPFHHEGHVSGMICLVAAGDQRFDDDDLRLLQILADQSAVAIENARLLRGSDQMVQELAGLLDISEAAISASDETGLAKHLASRIRHATRTDAALVSRWDDGSTFLRILSRDGNGFGVVNADELDLAESPARWAALRDGRPQVVQADSAENGTEQMQLRMAGANTLIVLPLTAGGRTMGLIELVCADRRVPSDSEMHACEAMASLGATGLEKVRLVEQLRSAADMDLVTGVHNHRYLQDRLRQEVARSARGHSPLALLMMDLDKFKPINDRYGHADGDRVLHSIGATIKAAVRTNDIVARYGGDEFVVLMAETSVQHAELVARRVVSGILQRRHELSDGKHVSVGVSAGLAFYPEDGRTSARLLAAADSAMYEAKRKGGRRIERSTLPVMGEPVAVRVAG
ncbi:MAG: sensor domain-containing diguanylate cyclase [Chloroflexota bacterium]